MNARSIVLKEEGLELLTCWRASQNDIPAIFGFKDNI